MSGPRDILAAIGHPSRAAVLAYLANNGPASATQIAVATDLGQPAIRAQLIRLHHAGVITPEAPTMRRLNGQGSNVRYYPDTDAIRYASRWLDQLAGRADESIRDAALVPMANGRRR